MRFSDGARQRVACPFCNAWNENFQFQEAAQRKRYFTYERAPGKTASTAQKEQASAFPYSSQKLRSQAKKAPIFLESSLKQGLFLTERKRKRPFFFFVSNYKKLYFFAFGGLMSFALLVFCSLLFMPGIYFDKRPRAYMAQMHAKAANRILDRKGRLVAELFSIKRGRLQAHEIPERLKSIVVFVEDQHFYEHGGIHWPSVLRALWHNTLHFAFRQGASTITQQLARMLLEDKKKTLLRKWKEAALAYALEASFSKEEILTAYLNFLYLGHGSYGVQSAARFYFRSELSSLNFSQELILAALPSAPERYSPLRRPHALEAKIQTISKRMQEAAFPIPQDHQEEMQRTLAALRRSPSANVYTDRIDHAPYVTEYIRQRIGAILGESYMYNAGLEIQSSLDLELQKISAIEAEAFITQQIPFFKPQLLDHEGKAGRQSPKEILLQEGASMDMALVLASLPSISVILPRLQTAFIGIENGTGNILFMQGGSKFGPNNQLNRAIAMYRQTGSAIKPILYAWALEKSKITSLSFLEDRPIFQNREVKEDGAKDYWSPRNYGGIYHGSVSVRRALAFSHNLASIRLAKILGMRELQNAFRSFFFPEKNIFKKRFRRDDTVALGSLEMSPLEMALAYSAFANNGFIIPPKLILSIRDSEGKELYSHREGRKNFGIVKAKRKVLSGDVAEIMVDLLKSAFYQSGLRKTLRGSHHFVGKTGTSNQYKDAWFVGLSPQVSAALWMGFDRPRYSMKGGTGARIAAPLWGRIMRHVKHTGESAFSFHPRAKSALICPVDASAYTPACPEAPERAFFRRKDDLSIMLSNARQSAGQGSSSHVRHASQTKQILPKQGRRRAHTKKEQKEALFLHAEPYF